MSYHHTSPHILFHHPPLYYTSFVTIYSSIRFRHLRPSISPSSCSSGVQSSSGHSHQAFFFYSFRRLMGPGDTNNRYEMFANGHLAAPHQGIRIIEVLYDRTHSRTLSAGGGHIPVVERLLKGGAKVNVPALIDGGRTPLQAAAGGGYLPIVEILLKEGAKVNAPATYDGGRTAL